jgi:hypothetical protein
VLRVFRYLPLVACVLFGVAGPADAQIYSWCDANGNRVYSDHPPEDTARSFRVIGTRFRSTRPADVQYANLYDPLIKKHAAMYAVSPDLVRAVVQVESGFNPRAVSAKGAMGLMQLMPSTAIEMGVRNVFDPDENIRGGVAYLRQLLNRYAGDRELALAAYNAGPDAVERHGYQVPPFRETQQYVSQVHSRSGAGGVAVPVVTGKRAAAAAQKPVQPARIYRWWEKTVDGRLIQKFSDTKPASGRYEIVR